MTIEQATQVLSGPIALMLAARLQRCPRPIISYLTDQLTLEA
jgi:hypothetical protein